MLNLNVRMNQAKEATYQLELRVAHLLLVDQHQPQLNKPNRNS